MRKIIILFLLVAFFIIIYFFQKNLSSCTNIKNDTASPPPILPSQIAMNENIKIIADNLQVPWALAFLPDGSFLFTERIGKVSLWKEGSIKLINSIAEVKSIGEGGLLGIAIHPQFISNHFIYLYYTYNIRLDKTLNKVARYKYEDEILIPDKIIIDNIPGASIHNGGRIKFGPDEFLYIATGDAANPSLAQDTAELAGKILRVKSDGTVPPDNPFGNAVYSFGHRNPQGLAWDANGNLWETEHGSTAYDEINKIEKGKNYGWPKVRGDEKENALVSPIIHSGEETWAPAGLAILNNNLYFSGLRGETLYRVVLGQYKLQKFFTGKFGRLREMVLGPDKFLYFTTSNQDGRGKADKGSDKIIKIDPEFLK